MVMRIASLLPSATEIAFALGLGDQVVAVSHECDYPSEAAKRPVLTKSTIHGKIHASHEVDDEVSRRQDRWPHRAGSQTNLPNVGKNEEGEREDSNCPAKAAGRLP